MHDNKIIRWEYATDRVQYFTEDDKSHSYLIDFKVFISETEWFYLEVKGFLRKNDELKWKAVREKYRLDVWFEKDIVKHETVLSNNG